MSEATAKRNARIVASLDSLRTAVALFDENDVLIYHNEQYPRTYQSFHGDETLIGRKFSDLLRDKLGNGEIAGSLALDDPEKWIADRIARRQNAKSGPTEVQLTDGRWIQVSERLTDSGDTIGVYQDITRQKKSDYKLHDMVAGDQYAVALWDQAGKLILRNPKFANLFMVAGRAVPTGETSNAVFSAAATLFDLEGRGAEAWTAERCDAHRAPVTQGTIRHHDGRVFMITDRRTRDGGVATIVADITALNEEEKSLRERGQSLSDVVNELELSKNVLEQHSADLVLMIEELAVSNSQLEAGNASKTQFLSMVSHELRTPMNAIIGFSEIIKGQILGPIGNEKYLEYAEDIHDGAQHLLALVNGLLDMSKIEAGKWDLHPVAISVKSVMESCCRLMRVHAAKKSVKIEILCDDPTPVIVADPKALRQIFLNLLSNAIKFSYKDGRILLSARERGDFVEFRVADDGLGIPASDLKRILLPFEQVDNDLTRSHEGTGLGLTMCQSLMELHGGSLHIESTEGEGATVSFSIVREGA
jgi:two-component system, cell cycle sensor histidine kinase PleC